MILVVFDLILLRGQVRYGTEIGLLKVLEVYEFAIEVLELRKVVLKAIVVQIHELASLWGLSRDVFCEILVHELLKIREVLATDTSTSKGINEGLSYGLVLAVLMGRFELRVDLL